MCEGEDTYVRELSQETGGSKENINTGDTGLYGEFGVVHVAPGVGEGFGAKAQVGDGLAVGSALGRSSRASELNILHTKVVQHLRDLNLLLGSVEGIHKLLSLAEGRLDDIPVARFDIVCVSAVAHGGSGGCVGS